MATDENSQTLQEEASESIQRSQRRGFLGVLGAIVLFFTPKKASAGTWKQVQSTDGTGASGTWGISVSGSANYSKQIPVSSTSGTLIASDAGKCVNLTANIAVPASVFSPGDIVTLYNSSASAVTITQGSGLTLRQVGSATVGGMPLASKGIASLWFASATEAIYSGAVTSLQYTVEYLVVGGGGGVMSTSYQAPPGGGATVTAGTQSVTAGASAITVTIGAGGTPTSNDSPATNGATSSFGGVLASGGLGSSARGGDGAASGNGNRGGYANTWAGGGGGGAGGPGGDSSGYKGSTGSGGPGVVWSNGSYYGGGGGGAGYNGGVGSGGSGGGGAGQFTNGTGGVPGTANTGGGGGGRAGDAYTAYPGVNGGSGVVIVRYAGTPVGTGGTITQNGGYTYHTFTSSGTFSP